MSRRNRDAAQAAADAASEAARVLQQRQQESIKAKEEPKVEPAPEPQTTIKQPDERKVKRGNPERESMLAELRKSRGEPEEVTEPVAEPKAEEKKPAEPAPEAPKETEVVEAKTEAPADAPKTVRVKVDGVEEDVAESVIDEYGGVKGYQIAKAAENRLAKAKEITEENRKTQSQLAQIAQLLMQQHAPKQPDQKATAEQLIKSKMDIIRFGTPEEATAAFLEAIQSSQPKPVDQGAIVNMALAAVQKTQAVEAFRKDFPEVIANPLLLKLAVSLEQEELANAQKSGQPIDWRNLYSRIGNQVRSVVPRQSQPQATQQTTSTTSQPSDKEARKASITVLPTASARAELPKEEKPETREEQIARMKRARGQT